MLLKAKISKGGKIVIPSLYRKKLQLKEGEEVLLDMKENTVVISSMKSALEKARQIVNKYHPESESLVDKLIAERREAARY